MLETEACKLTAETVAPDTEAGRKAVFARLWALWLRPVSFDFLLSLYVASENSGRVILSFLIIKTEKSVVAVLQY